MSDVPPPPPPPPPAGGGRSDGREPPSAPPGTAPIPDVPPPGAPEATRRDTPPPPPQPDDDHVPGPEARERAGVADDSEHIPGSDEIGAAPDASVTDHIPDTDEHPCVAPQPTVPPPGAPPELDDRLRPLDPKIVPFWRLSTATSVLIPGTIATMIVGGFLGTTAATAALVVVFGLAVFFSWWYPPAKYARWRWRLTDLAVELHHGVLVRTTETLPYFRIQQIDVNQGPIDRLLDLASLQVTSASASGSVLLPGIALADAPAVRRALLERAAEAAVGDDGNGTRDAV